MSFILDALKKSESERQRQSGPALFEVKVAPPRSRFAVWGAAIAALLLINFVVVGFVLWHGSTSRASAPAGAAQSGAVSAAPETKSASSRYGVRAEPGAALNEAGAPIAATSVPPSANAAAAGSTAVTGTTAAAGPTASAGTAANVGSTATVGSAAARANAPAASAGQPGAAVAGSVPSTVASTDTGANPDDLAPAVEPHAPATQPVTGVIRATESGLPTYQDAAAEPGADIPDLKLDLHVYSPQADQRFVFLNMLKLREGDTTPQGVHVERITEDGVILSYRGKEFVLQRR